ncbi:unnamed protein product [Medioppia subpectinata]|uniref:MIT domain-containing protein n=1 Tax=Medioppia subpectinata TaxID=1979941 RepID=A0A7R9LMT8_9ACAR|nr:unnamed protein product [Medioppia subpectinata]CAG2119580.1 unnamed protein product [Medioppia subpectinata]
MARAHTLLDGLTKKETKPANEVSDSEERSQLLRAECLMREALDEDREDNREEALELYTQAITLCIEAVNN